MMLTIKGFDMRLNVCIDADRRAVLAGAEAASAARGTTPDEIWSGTAGPN